MDNNNKSTKILQWLLVGLTIVVAVVIVIYLIYKFKSLEKSFTDLMRKNQQNLEEIDVEMIIHQYISNPETLETIRQYELDDAINEMICMIHFKKNTHPNVIQIVDLIFEKHRFIYLMEVAHEIIEFS